MAFTDANWTCISASLNQGQETVTPFGGSPTVLNAPNQFSYGSPTDAVATIAAANYFLPQYASLSVGDWIFANGTDASEILIVTAVSSTSVTTAGFAASGTVNTANIVNNAVTYAKIQQASAADVLLGNPTGGAANYQEVTLGNGLDFASTALELKPSYLNVVEVSLTAAQWNGMYATPVQVVAAPGANKVVIINHVVLNMTYGTTQFSGGGAVGLQYGNTDHLGGIAASATEAATDFTGAAASTIFRFGGGLSTGAATSSAANTAVYISNASAAFTAGDSTFKAWVYYEVLPTNS
jgi:hypothetical protein